MTKTVGLVGLSFVLTAFCSQPAGKDGRTSAARAHAAAVLESQFETVFHAPASRIVHAARSEKTGVDYLTLAPLWMLDHALESLNEKTFEKAIGGSSSVLVGARDFQAPDGLGVVGADACYVLLVTNRAPFDAVFGQAQASSTGPIRAWMAPGIEGHRSGFTFSARRVGDEYVVVCSDAAVLASVAGALSMPSGGPKAPWMKDVEDREIWAYRRYRHGEGDPTASGSYVVAPDAQRLIVVVRQDETRALLRLIGETGLASEHVSSLPFTLQRQAGREWSAEIPLTASQEDNERAFVILGMFGFTVYL